MAPTMSPARVYPARRSEFEDGEMMTGRVIEMTPARRDASLRRLNRNAGWSLRRNLKRDELGGRADAVSRRTVVEAAQGGLPKTLTALNFAKRLVGSHGRITPMDVANLHRAGFSDREIFGIISSVMSGFREPDRPGHRE